MQKEKITENHICLSATCKGKLFSYEFNDDSQIYRRIEQNNGDYRIIYLNVRQNFEVYFAGNVPRKPIHMLT